MKTKSKLLPKKEFALKLIVSILIGLLIICLSLLVGMVGYHYFESLSWVDSFANASMILSGMGPLTHLETNGGKIFAGFYALFSGLAFIVVLGIILAPILHRFFHRIHLDVFNED